MCAVVPSVLKFALAKHYEVLIFQIKMHKPLRRAQPAAFLFEILRVNRVLPVQIAALGITAHISVSVLAILRERY